MRKIDIDYSNTIIYKITCKDPSITHVYVGHTINFVKRKQCHKQSCNNDKNPANNCKLYKVIRENGGWENWTMEIVNFFNCRDHYEARKNEQEYFVLLNATLNSIEPMPKPKEEYNDDQPTIKPVCETCNKIFDNEQLYTAHVNTNNHKKRLDNTYSQPNFINKKFKCKICSITCARKTEWIRHINTKKHKTKENYEDINILTNIPDFICDCGKTYKDRTGLWRHKKICNNTILNDNNQIINLILEVVKGNNELQKQNQDFQKQILDVYKNCIDNNLTT